MMGDFNFEGIDKEKMFESFLLFQSFMNMNNTINNLHSRSRDGTGLTNTIILPRDREFTIDHINIEIANEKRRHDEEKRNRLINQKVSTGYTYEPERDSDKRSAFTDIVNQSSVIDAHVKPVIVDNIEQDGVRYEDPDDRPIKGNTNYQFNDKQFMDNFVVAPRKKLVEFPVYNDDEEPHDRCVVNIDEIVIVPKAKNFLELLERGLADDKNTGNEEEKPHKQIIKKPRFKKVINISQPTETKKYKYYSDNFDKAKGKCFDYIEKEDKPDFRIEIIENKPVKALGIRSQTQKKINQKKNEGMK
jgi:hypothetical protein